MNTIGDTFINLLPELDTDDKDSERTTPPGHVWRIADANHVDHCAGGTVWDLVCDATGAWICPTDVELARDFIRRV